jgi:hypothetical protein
MISWIHDVDIPVRIHGDVVRVVKLPWTRAAAAPLRDEHASVREDLDALAVALGGEDSARGIAGDTVDTLELAGSRTSLAPLQNERAIGRELLNAVVADIGNVHEAVDIDGDVGWGIKLARDLAVTTQAAQECSFL